MQYFSKDDHVLIDNVPVRVEKFIADGKQGQVYKAVDPNNEEKALKFVFGSYAPDKDKAKFYIRTKVLAAADPFHPAFAWPSGVGKYDEATKTFCYTMPLKSGYHPTSELIRHPKKYPQTLKAKVALKALEPFVILEENGFLYADVSEMNIMYKINSVGDVVIAVIDCENITEEKLTLGLAGNGIYRAPEVLLGSPPTLQSMDHAISVWVYRLLVAGVHPLKGSSYKEFIEKTDDIDEAKVVRELYGENPEFVFSGGNNRPYPNVEKAWDELPPLMRMYFSYTFSEDVLKGRKERQPIKYLYACLKKAYNL